MFPEQLDIGALFQFRGGKSQSVFHPRQDLFHPGLTIEGLRFRKQVTGDAIGPRELPTAKYRRGIRGLGPRGFRRGESREGN